MAFFQNVRSPGMVISSRVGVLGSETGAGSFPVLNETMKGCCFMRSMFRGVLVALLVALALGTVAASGASAHNFVVEGRTLAGEEAFTGSSATAKFVLQLGSTQVKFTCTKESAAGDFQSEGRFALGKLKFTRCVETPSETCSLADMALSVKGSLGGLGVELTGSGEKEELTEFTIGACSLSGTYKMSGHWTCELHEKNVEAVEHEVICKATGSHIEVGGSSATLAYSEKVKLVSGKKWSTI